MGGADDRARKRFAEVVMPHLDAAYALARWLAGNQHDAEDIVQDACVRAFRSINQYAGGSARAWVLTIVRNTAYSLLARNKHSPLVATPDLSEIETAAADDIDHPSPEAALIAKADAAQLDAAIAALPPPFRETLVLRDIDGLSYRDIATITATPIGTVMSRLARARKLLLAAIGKTLQ
jgi:RNA polymerase sigma-70 factor (ECF subfamily)